MMAAWLENSFGDLAKPSFIKKESSEPRGEPRSQPTTTSSGNNDCMIAYVQSNRSCMSELPSHAQVRPTNSSTKHDHERANKTKQSQSGSKNVSSKDQSQPSYTLSQDQIETSNGSNGDQSEQRKRTNEGGTQDHSHVPCRSNHDQSQSRNESTHDLAYPQVSSVQIASQAPIRPMKDLNELPIKSKCQTQRPKKSTQDPTQQVKRCNQDPTQSSKRSRQEPTKSPERSTPDPTQQPNRNNHNLTQSPKRSCKDQTELLNRSNQDEAQSSNRTKRVPTQLTSSQEPPKSQKRLQDETQALERSDQNPFQARERSNEDLTTQSQKKSKQDPSQKTSNEDQLQPAQRSSQESNKDPTQTQNKSNQGPTPSQETSNKDPTRQPIRCNQDPSEPLESSSQSSTQLPERSNQVSPQLPKGCRECPSQPNVPRQNQIEVPNKPAQDRPEPSSFATRQHHQLSNRPANPPIRSLAAPSYFPAGRRANTLNQNRYEFAPPRNLNKIEIRTLRNITKKDKFVNVIAVVSFFNPPKQTTRPDKSFFFGLVDPTLYGNDDCLKCICFERFEEDMPLITNIGDIVKFPCLRISVYKGNLQGRNCDGPFPWITFDGRPYAPVVPRYSRCLRPAFTDADKKKVEELKSWASTMGICVSYLGVTLAQLADHENSYFDFLCQVVHVDSVRKMLHVWDGTEPSFKGLLSIGSDVFASATKWGRKVVDKCVRVWIFGYDLESVFKTGQYILITNLHFKLKADVLACNESEDVTQIPILALHEGSSFRRGIRILEDGDVDITALESRMEALPTPPISQRQDSPEVPVTSKQPIPDGETDLSNIEKLHPTKRRRFNEDVAKLTRAECQTSPTTSSKAFANIANTTATNGNSSSHSNQATVKPRTLARPAYEASEVTPADKGRAPPLNQATKIAPADETRARPSNQVTETVPVHMASAKLTDVANASARPSNLCTSRPIDEATARFDGANVACARPEAEDDVSSVGPANRANQVIDKPTTRSKISLYTIEEIKSEAVPSKFRCHAAVRYVLPRHPIQFVVYACSSCRKRYKPNEIKDMDNKPDFNATEKCPHCRDSLSLSLQLSFILEDNTGTFDVMVLGDVAKKFFLNVDPLDLLTDKNTRGFVEQRLLKLIRSGCRIEFEIKRYERTDKNVETEKKVNIYLVKEGRYPSELE